MTFHHTKHEWEKKDENTQVCKCGVTLTGKKYEERVYHDAAGNKMMKPPHCSLKINRKEPEGVLGLVPHEARKIECLAFIFSVYDKIFKGKDFEMEDIRWELKQSAETILMSNGVII